MKEEGLDDEWRDVMEIIAGHLEGGTPAPNSVPALGTARKPRILKNAPR
jgi:hypothetical protein